MSFEITEEERKLECQIKRQKLTYTVAKLRADVVDKQTAIMETQKSRLASVRKEHELAQSVADLENKIAEAELAIEELDAQ